MAEQYCNQVLEEFLQLARYRESFFFSLCVSNFAFSLVTSLGNILVIRALFKASSIPANVKNLFLSLAFSDLGVGLVSQLMAGIIFAVILNTASKQDYNLTSLCPTVINLWLYLFFFLCAASLLTLTTIAFDRLLAVSLHLRYQELVTSKRVTICLVPRRLSIDENERAKEGGKETTGETSGRSCFQDGGKSNGGRICNF